MLINILISVSLFKNYGFIIIPIATSVSTWIGVLVYFYLLKHKKFIRIEKNLLLDLLKISLAVILMSFFLYFSLEYFEDKFEYSSNFKLIYLIIVVSLSAGIYLFATNLLGVLNLKSYRLK